MLNYNRIIFFCVLIYFPQIALSDDTHYKDMLFGGRAAGMGGAYIAISDDTSGFFIILRGLFMHMKIVFPVAEMLFISRIIKLEKLKVL